MYVSRNRWMKLVQNVLVVKLQRKFISKLLITPKRSGVVLHQFAMKLHAVFFVWNFRPFLTPLRRVFLNKMCFWVFRAEQIFFPPVYGLFYRQKIRSMICYPKKRDVVAWRMVWSFTQKKPRVISLRIGGERLRAEKTFLCHFGT